MIMTRCLSDKFLQLFETIGRDRLDYLNSLDAQELRDWIDASQLDRLRAARRDVIKSRISA